ncbi:penicillin-binding protein 1A [Oceanicoccus sagamiensis]|uniref:Penicillin-binding protein 1A n=1 Tax=Oceanicoccus sagamiensis TaxID=716816 RepID=A0A1X9NJP7_9GAMM|nr:penicillin-binding protein 1A [Oceanicoccus sagamiensis]ARN74203.1 peptidase [Oceanicoccus sagamiensis]
MAHITNFTRIILWLLLSASTGALLILVSAYLYLSPKLPPVDVLKDVQLQTPLRIYSTDNQLIGEFGEKRRSPVTFNQIPTQFVQAILAAEDDRFFDHHGVDIKGLLRAASQLLVSGSIKTGGSTITMQVAKNYFLSFEKTFSRKFNEILLALQIERELPKQEILELYVNKIFLGNRAYGIEAAAQVYYGKSISELDLAQLAMIAGLPKAPSAYNPLVNPSRAIIRRNWILNRMLDLKYIDDNQHIEAISSPITATYHGSKVELYAPYIAEMVRKDMLKRYGRATYTDGFRVYTTINSELQASATKAVISGLLAYDQRHGYRGPEQNLAVNDDSKASAEQDNSETTGEPDYTGWLNQLRKASRPGDLVPAVVIDVQEQSASALLASGDAIEIAWENGLKGKRPYVTVDRLGPNPKTASDVVAIGDVIRVQRQADGQWLLTQLPAAQAALVSLDADNGAILSLVGGFNYSQSKFNRITQATRQPGSNFKPFVYTAALANGFTPASTINDAPIVFEDASLESTWRPTNDGGKFYGPTRLRYALFKSRNLVSIRLLRSLGISKAINYVEKFGFDTSQLPRDLSLALGSHSLTPMEIVSGYSVLANGGYSVQPYLIQQIDDINGEALYKAMPNTVCRSCDDPAVKPVAEATEELATLEDILQQADSDPEPALPEAERVIEARVAYIIDSMMRDVVKKGTGRKARKLGRNDLAGKTGTTNGPTDAWFSGYGGGIVTTAWFGFDKNGVLGNREYGGSAALPIWIDYMAVALKGRPEIAPKQPEGIVTVKIDPTTGLLAKPGQSNAIFEIFREELAPTKEADSDDISGDTSQIEEVMEEDIF